MELRAFRNPFSTRIDVFTYCWAMTAIQGGGARGKLLLFRNQLNAINIPSISFSRLNLNFRSVFFGTSLNALSTLWLFCIYDKRFDRFPCETDLRLWLENVKAEMLRIDIYCEHNNGFSVRSLFLILIRICFSYGGNFHSVAGDGRMGSIDGKIEKIEQL